MKNQFLLIVIPVFLLSCNSDNAANVQLTETDMDSIEAELFVDEIRMQLPNDDTSFVFFRTRTQDKSLFLEIHYTKEQNEKNISYLYTKDFYGKTIDSSIFSAGVYSIGKPYIEVNKDRSIMLIDSQKINLEPYWVEIKTASDELVTVMCQADTTICCDTVIFKIDIQGRITCSNSWVKNRISIN